MDPVLEQIKEKCLNNLRDEIAFILERITIERSEDLEVDSNTPENELPLYTTEDRGEVNAAIAKIRMDGEDDYLLSMSLIESVTPIIDAIVREENFSSIDYALGKIYMAATILDELKEPAANIAHSWAGIQTSA